MIDLFSLIKREKKHLEGKTEDEMLSHILKTIEKEVIYSIAPEARPQETLKTRKPKRPVARPEILRRYTA